MMIKITPYICVASVRSIALCLRLAILWLFSLASLCSCDHQSDSLTDTFAIEAWIDSDDYPVVMVSRVVAPGSSPVDVADVMVRWAKVTISDGSRTVILTGGMDYAVFPPFSYRSYEMKGQVGSTYTITAELDGIRASAKATILPPPRIKCVTFSQISDSIYSATLDFVAPADADTCRYVLFTRVLNTETRHYPAFMCPVSSYLPEQQCSVPLYRGKHLDSLYDYRPDFCLGDTVDVILARVEPQVYRFWDAYHYEVYFGNKIFLSAISALDGNVVGGSGVFSARGISRGVFVVK